MKYSVISFLCLCVLVFGGLAVDNAMKYDKTSSIKPTRTIILDAGHGGEDGGTSSKDGTAEKDINLVISNEIAVFMDFFGIDYIPVRTTDISVCDDGLDTVRKRKYSDIMNRYALVNSVPDAVLLSIHQNYYTESRYSGAQVFYSGNICDSKVLAQNIQNSIVSNLQPDNTRKIKASSDDIFLLHKAKTTSVLVECGFMSNEAECEKLKDEKYEAQMAYFIFRGLLDFLADKKDV